MQGIILIRIAYGWLPHLLLERTLLLLVKVELLDYL